MSQTGVPPDLTPRGPMVYARLIGVLYLVLLIVGPFSLLYVPSVIVEPGNAAATFDQLVERATLFRLAQAGYAVVILADLAIAVLLYVLFRPAGLILALLSLFGRLGTAFTHGTVLLLNLLVLLIVGDASVPTAFTQEQREALVLLLVEFQQGSGPVWGLFFGLHCGSIGLLARQSGYVPKSIGSLMGIAGLAYWINAFGLLLWPGLSAPLAAIVGVGSLGEIAFAGWLLVKGVNAQARRRR